VTGHVVPCDDEHCRAALAAALPTGAPVQGFAQLSLPPEPRSVALARHFVDAWLPELVADTRDALLLLTSELVTNAVIHARTPLEVAVIITGVDVVVTVRDEDRGRSAPPGRHRQHDRDRDGGRGLVLVRMLSCDSGLVRHRAGGKTAWFRLERVARSGHGAVAL